MYRLVPALVQQMGETYPRAGARAAADHRDAEAGGDALPQDARRRAWGCSARRAARSGRATCSPATTAFKLYDTFGFPLDLTQDALKRRGISVDTAAFDAAMQKQKEEARKAWKGSGEAATESVWFEIKERIGATDFLGYDTESRRGRDPRRS